MDNNTTEYNDNRLSLIAGQRGRCYITKTSLIPWKMECHHKKPKHLGGTDEYKNLVWLSTYWGSVRKTRKIYVKTVITKNTFYQNILPFAIIVLTPKFNLPTSRTPNLIIYFLMMDQKVFVRNY